MHEAQLVLLLHWHGEVFDEAGPVGQVGVQEAHGTLQGLVG